MIAESVFIPLEYQSYRLPRPPGIHISDCLDWLQKRGVFRSDPTEYGSVWEYTAPMGFAWEDLFILSLKSQKEGVVSGQHYVVEDVIFTPDAYDPTEKIIYETKTKWASSKRFKSLENWRWLAQIKSYCYGLGCNQAILAVMFLNGDGAPPASAGR